MKLAFITHNFPVDEIERSNAGIFVSDLVNELADKGHAIDVYVVNSVVTKRKTLSKGRVNIYFLGQGGLKKSLGHVKPYNIYDLLRVVNLFIQSRRAIERLFSRKKYDFCIACWAIPSGVLAYQVCKKKGIPYAVWALGSDVYVYQKYPILGTLIREAVKYSEIMFADGINLAKRVEELNKKVCVFLSSATSFSKVTEVSTLIDPKQVNFIFLGRMEKVKGPDVFLEALSRLPKNLSYHAYFLGGGIMYKKIEKKMYEYGLEEYVTLLGNVDDINVIYSYLKNANFLVIPSRSDSIPLVLTESAKAGTPVITSDVGDLKKLISTFSIGYVFKSENVLSLTKILKLQITNPSKKITFKANLKKFAKEFDVGHTAGKLIKLIR